jgi:hypothetical protein
MITEASRPKGRQHRHPALVGFALVKGIRVARGKGLHHRMMRLKRLDQAMALAPRPPGPAGYL